jgi:hypothetical protein
MAAAAAPLISSEVEKPRNSHPTQNTTKTSQIPSHLDGVLVGVRVESDGDVFGAVSGARSGAHDVHVFSRRRRHPLQAIGPSHTDVAALRQETKGEKH